MLQTGNFPLEFIMELSSPKNYNSELVQNNDFNIYKTLRTSGRVQDCIIGRHNSIYISKFNPDDLLEQPTNDSTSESESNDNTIQESNQEPSLSIYNNNEMINEVLKKDKYEWRIRNMFNSSKAVDNMDLKNETLEKGIYNAEKIIGLNTFCRLNNISKLTLNVTQLKKEIFEDDSTPQLLHACYHHNKTTDTLFTDHISSIKPLIIDYYEFKLDRFIMFIKNNIDFVKIEII